MSVGSCSSSTCNASDHNHNLHQVLPMTSSLSFSVVRGWLMADVQPYRDQPVITPSGLAASLGGQPSDVFTNALITDAETQP
eukprot:904738-Prymnesium_polylepis.1